MRVAVYEGAYFGDVIDSTMAVLDRAVKAIRVESAWGPRTRITDPFAPSPSNEPSVVGSLLKPKITFEMRTGWGGDRSITPYGDPGPSKFPLLVAGVAAVFLLGAAGIFATGRRTAR